MTIFEKFKKNPDPDFLPLYQMFQPPWDPLHNYSLGLRHRHLL
jgi:hypothetical protein